MKPLAPEDTTDFSRKLMRHSTVVLAKEPKSPRRRPEPIARARSETALVNQRHGPAMTKEECQYKCQRLAQMGERIAKSQQFAMMAAAKEVAADGATDCA